jgi:tetratricopeptide (TPR) repeat protein
MGMKRKARIAAGVCIGIVATLVVAVLVSVFSPARAHRRRGNAFLENYKYEQAMEAYTKAIALDPGMADAYNGRGIARRSMGQAKQAIEDFTRAIELDGDFAQAYRNRGSAWHGEMQHDKAIVDLTRAIEIDPAYGNAYFARGTVHLYQLKPAKAVEDLRAAVANCNDPTLPLAWLGAVHIYARKPRLAEAALNKAIERDPSRPAFLLLRGQAYELSGEKQKAERDYKKALEIRGGSGEMGSCARRGLERLRTPGANSMKPVPWLQVPNLDRRD